MCVQRRWANRAIGSAPASVPLSLPPADSAMVQSLSHPERGISQLPSAGRLSGLLCCQTGPDYYVLMIMRELTYFIDHTFCGLNDVSPYPSKYIEALTPGTYECDFI